MKTEIIITRESGTRSLVVLKTETDEIVLRAFDGNDNYFCAQRMAKKLAAMLDGTVSETTH